MDSPTTSLIPIFLARLKVLHAIASGLRELPTPMLNELQSLLERAEAVIQESEVTAPIDPIFEPSRPTSN
jgi:hypothetical protein